MASRGVYYVSDGTGITAETFGQSLLTQFPDIQFEEITLANVKTRDNAQTVVQRISQSYEETGLRPLVFSTLVEPEVKSIVAASDVVFMDIFSTFLSPIEQELQVKSSHALGLSHGVRNVDIYKTRIDAVNFTLTCDDGANTHRYEQADIIILGVSRCGKTPTSLYMALQFGILVANFPFTIDDMDTVIKMPSYLKDNKHKLYGLLIEPKELHFIRNERRPHSDYSNFTRCQQEVRQTKSFYLREKIPYMDSTHASIEEMATHIMQATKTQRKW